MTGDRSGRSGSGQVQLARRRRRRFIAIFAGAMLASVLVSTALLWPHGEGEVERFSERSFWNVAVPEAPRLALDSELMVRALAANADSAHIANSREWGIPIAEAAGSDPAFRMRSTMHRIGREPVTCRIPRAARPSAGSDGHLTVIQPDGTVCDFWQFRWQPDGRPAASTVAKVCGRVVGPNRTAWGTVPCRGRHGGGATASGFALLGGLLRPEELVDERPIRHALQLVLPASLVRARPAWPATHSDGECRARWCIPEGARIQLSPRFDVDGQGWPAWKRKLARALQTHGAYVADRGGSLSIRAESRHADGAWTTRGIRIDEPLDDLPWDQMRVLELPSAPHGVPAWWRWR